MCFVAAGMCCNISLLNLILLGRGGERRRDIEVCSSVYPCIFVSDACPGLLFLEHWCLCLLRRLLELWAQALRYVNVNKNDI